MTNAPWPDQTNEPYDVMPDDVYEAARADHAARQKRQENFGQRIWAQKVLAQQSASTAPPPPSSYPPGWEHPPGGWVPPPGWTAPRPPHPLDVEVARAVLSVQARKPGGDARGKQRREERQANVDYKAAFDAWVIDGRYMADLQQTSSGETARHNVEHVQRGADLYDFADDFPDYERSIIDALRAFKPAKGTRGVGWDDPRTRRPKPTKNRHNDWLRELRAMGYPAAKPTDE